MLQKYNLTGTGATLPDTGAVAQEGNTASVMRDSHVTATGRKFRLSKGRKWNLEDQVIDTHMGACVHDMGACVHDCPCVCATRDAYLSQGRKWNLEDQVIDTHMGACVHDMGACVHECPCVCATRDAYLSQGRKWNFGRSGDTHMCMCMHVCMYVCMMCSCEWS